MKSFLLFCRTFLIALMFIGAQIPATAAPADSTENYVVIGAFSDLQNAVRLASRASNSLHVTASYKLNASRNLYYVYLPGTGSRGEAVAEAQRLRRETEFQDAWVYRGNFGVSMPTVSSREVQGEPSREEVQSEPTIAEPVTAPQQHVLIEDVEEETAPEPPPTEREFFLKLTRTTDQADIAGKIEVIDPAKQKKMNTYDGNTVVHQAELKNSSGVVTLVAEAFGYRKLQRDLNVTAPQSDSTLLIARNGRVTVPLELVPMKKGDVAIMYNVFFFRDAAIMRPESKFEVTTLLTMLKEHTTTVIRIHGHTNGNHSGKIIYQGAGVTDFFTIDGSRDGYGSAKELSGARAEAIKNYLVAQGISADRLQTKAWGGKKAIHKKNSARAAENVRVEVEIVSE